MYSMNRPSGGRINDGPLANTSSEHGPRTIGRMINAAIRAEFEPITNMTPQAVVAALRSLHESGETDTPIHCLLKLRRDGTLQLCIVNTSNEDCIVNAERLVRREDEDLVMFLPGESDSDGFETWRLAATGAAHRMKPGAWADCDITAVIPAEKVRAGRLALDIELTVNGQLISVPTINIIEPETHAVASVPGEG